jgi:hypothetical protein
VLLYYVHVVLLFCVHDCVHVQVGDSPGAESLLQSALKHWQGEAPGRSRDPVAAAGVSWCLQRLVALKVAEVGRGVWRGRVGGGRGSAVAAGASWCLQRLVACKVADVRKGVWRGGGRRRRRMGHKTL